MTVLDEVKNIDVVTTLCRTLDELRPRSGSASYEDLITYVDDRPGHDLRYAIDSEEVER